MIFLKRKIKKFKSIFFFNNTLIVFLLFTCSFSQTINTEIHLLENQKRPFWISSNNHAIYSKGSIVNFNISENFNLFSYGSEIIFPLNQNEQAIFNQAFIRLNNDNLFFQIGKKSNLPRFSYLSSGSLIESTNAMPIPKILLGNIDFNRISIFDFNFQYLIKISHGWIKSLEYIKNPYLHEKSLKLKKEITKNSLMYLGFSHMAIWGGETIQHGKQPSKLSDLLRIVFALPGSKSSISQEQKNSLGNHLGVWNLSFEMKLKNKILRLYTEHPFEDESGARWLLNKFDGLYGINISRKESYLISNFTYEHINTMNQSGSEGASDSTYGWDNYYNHYIYQSGWTNNGRVIGNPLFTLGSNKGRYSDGQYIVNNRFRAHHFGLQGSISKKFHYKTLFTYSENFGIYPDENFFKSKNEAYRFDGGLIQRSGLFDLSIKNLFNKIDASLVYGIDSGELLYKTDSFMLRINHKFDI